MTNTAEAALRDALQNPQLDAALLRILQGGQGLGDAEKFAFRALRDCIATLATVGQDGGPFHVSRSSDGEKEWFSARDAAAGVSIPAKCRDDAYALVASLNRSCVTYAALSQPSPASSTAGEGDDYKRGIYAAKCWLRDQQHKNPPDSLWHAAAILADRMDVALLSSSGEPASVAAEAEARLLDIAAERAAQIRSSCFDYCTGDCNCAQAAESAVDEMERLVAALAEPASPAPVGEQGAVGWRCFHCGDTFTDERSARLHFGRDETSVAACVIKAGAEGSLLKALRDAEEQADDAIQRMHNESTDAALAFHQQRCRHNQALIAAEEAGYEKGLADGRALSTPATTTTERGRG